MTYDVACPICGKVKQNLSLDETNGWMECEHCGTSTQNLKFQKTVKIPVFRMDQIHLVEKYFSAKKTGKTD